LTNALAELFLN